MRYEALRKLIVSHVSEDPGRFHVCSRLNWMRYERKVSAVAREVHKRSKPAVALDIGCGLGQIAAMLSLEGLTTVGLDIVLKPRVWKLLSSRCNGRCCFLGADATALPIRDGGFDAVVTFGVLEHLENVSLIFLLRESWRSLRPRGLLFVFELPHERSASEWFARRLGLGAHSRLYSEREILSVLRQAGFRVLELNRTDVLPAQLGRINRFVGEAWNQMCGCIDILDRVLARTPLKNVANVVTIVAEKMPQQG